MAQTTSRTNRHPAPCSDCGQTVPAGDGILRNDADPGDRPAWQVTHRPARWVGSPVSGQWFGGCPKRPDFTESDPSTWETLPEGYYWAEIDTATGEQHLFAPDGRDVSAENDRAREPQLVEVLVSEELISRTFTVYVLVNGKITETVADHMTLRSAKGVAARKAQELGLAGYKL